MSDKAIVETNITKRWETGTPHHPKSVELFKKLAEIDFKHGGDFFCWKSGGDGDNGEHLMYEMDILFEREALSDQINSVLGRYRISVPAEEIPVGQVFSRECVPLARWVRVSTDHDSDDVTILLLVDHEGNVYTDALKLGHRSTSMMKDCFVTGESYEIRLSPKQ